MLENETTPMGPRKETEEAGFFFDHQLLGSYNCAAIKDIF